MLLLVTSIHIYNQDIFEQNSFSSMVIVFGYKSLNCEIQILHNCSPFKNKREY